MNNWLDRRADHEVDALFGIVTGAAVALFAAGLVVGFVTRLAWFLFLPGLALVGLRVVLRRAADARRRWER